VDALLPRDVAFILVLALLVVLMLQIMWLTGGRQRLTRLGDAVLTRLGDVSGGTPVVRSSDHAAAPVRHLQLEEELAAAISEIDRLRTRLAEATRKPKPALQMREEELTKMRQRRLWIARGGHRQP